jgi:hypothetical protein
VQSQKRQLPKLPFSDRPVAHEVLDEEAKITYLQLLRLARLEAEQREEFDGLQHKYNLLVADNCPDLADSQDRKIKRIQAEIEKYRRENRTLAAQAKLMRADRAFATRNGQKQVAERAAALREQIQANRRQTAETQKIIDDATEEHRLEMKALSAFLPESPYRD